MDRGEFGNGTFAGVAKAGAVAAPRPLYNNLISELNVIRNDRVRLGARGIGGGETSLSQENINDQRRGGEK